MSLPVSGRPTLFFDRIAFRCQPMVIAFIDDGYTRSGYRLWKSKNVQRRVESLMWELQLAGRAEAAAAAAVELQQKEGIVTEIQAGDQVAFKNQADPTMITTEAYRKRMMLRKSPKVLAALWVWWKLAPRKLTSIPPHGLVTEVIEQDGYIALLRETYRALSGDEGIDEHELEMQLAEDWIQDGLGKDYMTRETFGDAVFELADLWTESIGSYVYSDFLVSLADLVCTNMGAQMPTTPCAWRTMTDDPCCSGDVSTCCEKEPVVDVAVPVASDTQKPVLPWTIVCTSPPVHVVL